MFTSDIKKTRFAYIAFALYFALFAAVYEIFSHQVYSAYMIFAWVIPVLGGAFSEIFMLLSAYKTDEKMRRLRAPALQLLAGAVIWLTFGCVYKGVLDIYGTTNRLLPVFFIVGGVQFLASLVLMILSAQKGKAGV